ncbi:MAG TPA: hypothetical protein VGG72_15750 [Bryobacteraceae bacterium]|jgi:hypothetical protein
MSRLSAFFKTSDTEFGVFYPKHYLVAIFPTLAEADRAKEDLKRGGRSDEDVISVPGEEVIHFAEDHWIKDGLWGAAMRELSRIFGTEALYEDQDLEAAKEGAGFVAVYCPTESAKLEAWRVLDPLRPLAARYYSFGGIEHLAGDQTRNP